MNNIINGVKSRLRKKAVVFDTGGIKPTNQIGESWIGKVCWQRPGEGQPMCKNGTPMIPIATIFVEDSEYVPKALQNIKMINIFMDFDFWYNLGAEDYKDFFVINTYDNLENLVPCSYTSDEILAFPLVAKHIDNEFPHWEDIEEESDELFEMILELEKNYGIDYFENIYEENNVKHKIGGYPSSIQGGVGYDEGYEYVMQISSDEKADMNIVEDGNFYFGYNPITKKWSVRCDFY